LIQRELGVKDEPSKSFAQKLVNLYLNNYLQSLFAGAFVNHNYSPLKPEIALATEQQGEYF
jgi:hypothetical protein